MLLYRKIGRGNTTHLDCEQAKAILSPRHGNAATSIPFHGET
jgi:hypothetical protein